MFGERKFLSGTMLNLEEVRYAREDVQEATAMWVRHSGKKSRPFISLFDSKLLLTLQGPTQKCFSFH